MTNSGGKLIFLSRLPAFSSCRQRIPSISQMVSQETVLLSLLGSVPRNWKGIYDDDDSPSL